MSSWCRMADGPEILIVGEPFRPHKKLREQTACKSLPLKKNTPTPKFGEPVYLNELDPKLLEAS
jgi:hypothetical protein